MSRQPTVGQLSLLVGRPDVLEVNVCTADGCDRMHGGTGQCVSCRRRGAQTDAQAGRTDLAGRLLSLAALVDKGVPFEEIEPFADVILAGIDKRWRVLKGESLGQRFRSIAADLTGTES